MPIFMDRHYVEGATPRLAGPGTIRRAHQEWHGLVTHEIIEVDLAVVEAFLGRVTDPIPADPLTLQKSIDAAFRVIMFTDLKDSTLMTSTLGDRQGPASASCQQCPDPQCRACLRGTGGQAHR